MVFKLFCGVYICIMWLFHLFFLNSANLICQSMDISSISESPLEFEIVKVDCIIVDIFIK